MANNAQDSAVQSPSIPSPQGDAAAGLRQSESDMKNATDQMERHVRTVTSADLKTNNSTD